MSAGTKTDNHNPSAKLALRRYFLKKYHATGKIHVLDCCQATGVLWGILRREFKLASYWGLDVKPKKGRLKLDSVRVLAQPGWPQNVVDVDTYGAPWKHWNAMLPHVAQPVTVFLTIGATMFRGSTDKQAILALGLGPLIKSLPESFYGKLSDLGTLYSLARPLAFGLTIIEAQEALSDGNARYIGIRIDLKA